MRHDLTATTTPVYSLFIHVLTESYRYNTFYMYPGLGSYGKTKVSQHNKYFSTDLCFQFELPIINAQIVSKVHVVSAIIYVGVGVWLE